jgi:hypothetical protein
MRLLILHGWTYRAVQITNNNARANCFSGPRAVCFGWPTRHATQVLFFTRVLNTIHKGFLCFTTKAKRRVKAFSSLPHQQQQLPSTKSLDVALRIQKLNTPQPPVAALFLRRAFSHIYTSAWCAEESKMTKAHCARLIFKSAQQHREQSDCRPLC